MSEENKLGQGDWELSEDYYGDEVHEKSMSLEDFITKEDEGNKDEHGFCQAGDTAEGGLLEQTVADVRRVMALSLAGNDIGRIAAVTGLSESYVYNILVCAQGFREDDEIAVAHLVLG